MSMLAVLFSWIQSLSLPPSSGMLVFQVQYLDRMCIQIFCLLFLNSLESEKKSFEQFCQNVSFLMLSLRSSLERPESYYLWYKSTGINLSSELP